MSFFSVPLCFCFVNQTKKPIYILNPSLRFHCVFLTKIMGFFIRKMAYLYSALHAHTLLLDLEQLVVVANLDKINLNSSSSACSATNLAQNNYQPSISKSTITTSTAIATATITTSLSSSTFKSQPYQIVSALPLNESKLAKITNQRSTKTTPTAISTTTPSSSSPSSLDNLNQFNKTNFIKCTNGIHAMRYDTNHVKPLVTGNPFDSYFSKLINICFHTEALLHFFRFVLLCFDANNIKILSHGIVLSWFAL